MSVALKAISGRNVFYRVPMTNHNLLLKCYSL